MSIKGETEIVVSFDIIPGILISPNPSLYKIVNGGIPKNNRGSASLNWRAKKLNLFSTTTLGDSQSNGGGLFNSEFFDNTNPNNFSNEKRDYDRNRKNLFINLGAEYNLNEKTSLATY